MFYLQGSINVLDPQYKYLTVPSVKIQKKSVPRKVEMLYFYLKMHKYAFDGRVPPGPAGGAYSAP